MRARSLPAPVALAALALAALAVVLAPASPAAAGDGPEAGGPVDRVLVLSLPTVDWDDVQDGSLPHLARLLEQSAVADLSVRGISPVTDAGDGYATFAAGGRARGPDEDAGAAYDVDEVPGDSGLTAGTLFERRTGVEPSDGGLVSLQGPAMERRNAGLPYDTEVGALGVALGEEGVDRAVVANADRVEADEVRSRTAVLGLADADGAVPAGEVSDALVEEDPQAAGGLRLDLDAVEAAVLDTWEQDRAVVLVEGSDLVRADEARSLVTRAEADRQRAEAVAATDALVARLLEHVDLDRDAVVVVGPYHRSSGKHLTLAAVHAPGVEPGLLESASTRREGIVTLVDVAPTVLDLVGVDAPASMEGEPAVRSGSGGSWEDRLDWLVVEDEAAGFRDDLVTPVAVAFVLVQLVLWLLAAVANRRSRWLLRQVAWAALASLVFLAATYWAGLLPFERWGEAAYVAFLVGVSVAVGYALPAVLHRQRVDPLIGALALVVGTIVVDMLFLGATMQLSTPFGYSPTVGGRFAGVGNLAFGQLAAGSLLLAGLVAHRVRTTGGSERRALGWATGILVGAIVVDGAPIWGSDVGGVLALLPGSLVMLHLLRGKPIRVRAVVLAVVGAAAAVVVFGVLDLARPANERTHLGRLFEDVADQGIGSFLTVATRKLDANFAVLGRSVWTLMVPVVVAFTLYLLWRAPRLLRHIRHELPERDAMLAGFAVTAVLGFALNDSGIAVPGIMLGVLNATLVHELALAAGVLDDEGEEGAQPPAEVVEAEP